MIPLPQSFEIPRVQAERCETCRFSLMGECRRWPPIGQPGIARSLFPYVAPSDWCGEYQRKVTPINLSHPDG